MNKFSTIKRFNIFDNYIKSCDFEKFFYKLLLEHDNEWFETCMINGKDPEPTNKLKFIFDYLEYKNNSIKEGWEFKKFLFYKKEINGKVNYKIKNMYDNKIILDL